MSVDSSPGRWLAALLACAGGASSGSGTLLDPNDSGAGIVLTADRLGVTYTSSHAQAVRSDRAVEPGAGFFYFEGLRLAGDEGCGFGLATAAASLDAYGGSEGQSFGADISGGLWYGGESVGSFPFAPNATYGIAVDYRAAHPIAYVIAREVADGPSIVFGRVVLDEITAPIHILVYGTPNTTGVQQRLNPGNDLAAQPLQLDPLAALDAAYYRGSEDLVLGWNPPPILRVSVDQRVQVIGGAVTAHASATAHPKLRTSDGRDLTDSITWSEDRGSATGSGGTFSFTPDRLGSYELRARVAGEEGSPVSRTVRVTIVSSAAIDSDADGLSYAQELAAGTDPAMADSDGDSLRDDDELGLHATDALDPDSDGDGMPDGWEVEHALDPNAPDPEGDPDADTFTNLQEFAARTDPRSDRSYPGWGTVLLSETDKDPSIQLSDDRLGAIFTASTSRGVRTDVSVSPGSGWFYFEGHREIAPGAFGFGLASATAPLDASSGASDQCLLVFATGQIVYDGQLVGTFADPASVEWYGFALDYTGAIPRVHLIVERADDAPRVFAPFVLSGVSSALHILVFGQAIAAGVQQTINSGADPVARPFRHPAAYLTCLAGYPGAEFLGSGFGPEHAYSGRARVARQDPVVLVREAATNSELVLSADGLGASYNAPQKSAVRANQAMIGEFRYFETHREVGPVNVGQGLINPWAELDPYCCVSAGTDGAPPSMSMNSLGSIWQNLVWQANFPRENETCGFAVDYRGARPIVHCIAGGQLWATLALSDFITPIVPMLYGDPAGPVLVNTVNFGTKPFEYEPELVLAGAGVDPTGLVRGWGDANRPSANPNVRSRVTITAAPARVAMGEPIHVAASATDVDGADIGAFIEWSASAGASGLGASFVFTPATVGVQRVSARITDSLGSTSEAAVDVRVERRRPHSFP